MIDPPADLIDALFERAAQRDLPGAMAAVRAATEDGLGQPAVLAALAAVQKRVGDRWYVNEWDVADEHAATAVVDAALAALEAEGEPAPGRGPRIVVACPEGEWHALPARLLAADLRHRGAEVTFLGASMPAQHLSGHAARQAADLVALSTTTALLFASTAVAIDAVHAIGVPVVAGGPAYAGSAARAAALRAAGFATEAGQLLDLAGDVRPGRRRTDEPVDAGIMRMQLDREDVVEAALGALAARFAPLASYGSEQRARTREDLDYIARFAEAAVLVDDETVMDDFLAWLVPLLGARGVPVAALAGGLDALAAAATTDELQQTVSRARRRLVEPGAR